MAIQKTHYRNRASPLVSFSDAHPCPRPEIEHRGRTLHDEAFADSTGSDEVVLC